MMRPSRCSMSDGFQVTAPTEQLASAGVRVEVVTVPGVLHGHLNQPWTPQAQDSLEVFASWMR